MEIRPILSTLRRHKTAAALLALEVALTCAIVCNALFLIGQRIEAVGKPSGIDEDRVLEVRVNGIGSGANGSNALTAGPFEGGTISIAQGANVVALQTLLGKHECVVAAQGAHIDVDETGAPFAT